MVPGVIGAAFGALLGTLGWFAVSFPQDTVCTDFNEAQHACDALSVWLGVGFIGQWALALVSAFLLARGLRRPQNRPLVSVFAWLTVVIAIAWYSFYYYGASHSFNHH